MVSFHGINQDYDENRHEGAPRRTILTSIKNHYYYAILY